MSESFVSKEYLQKQFQNYSTAIKNNFEKKGAVTAEKLEYSNAEEPAINNVKSALDLLFEEGGGVLEAEIKPNVIMGSVKNEYPVGTSIEEIIRDMLTEKIAPNVTINLNPATTLYDEVKDSISSLTINAIVTKKTNDIKKI